MLVSELKQELEKYDKKELIKIAAELYKRVSKAKKEEYQIDEFIKDFKLQTKPQEKKVSLSDLQNEILEFLSDVDQGYYASPNRKVSKKERSGWRFKVIIRNLFRMMQVVWKVFWLRIYLLKFIKELVVVLTIFCLLIGRLFAQLG